MNNLITAAINSAATCKRRRRRSSVQNRAIMSDIDDVVDSSLSGSIAEEDEIARDGDQQSKFFFTIYETVSSTLTATSFSTNAVNIITLSAACTVAGAPALVACAAG